MMNIINIINILNIFKYNKIICVHTYIYIYSTSAYVVVWLGSFGLGN